MKLSRNFILTFCSYFDADLFQIQNPQEHIDNPEIVQTMSRRCAGSLNADAGIDSSSLVSYLQRTMKDRPREFVLVLSEASRYEWLEDQTMEVLFWTIIKEISSSLEQFQKVGNRL